MHDSNQERIYRTPPHSLTLLFSGVAGVCAWMPVHPLDVIKTRLQLNTEGGKKGKYKGVFDAAKQIAKTEGIKGLYGGISAGLTRQATYTTLRAGLYQIFRDKVTVFLNEGENKNENTKQKTQPSLLVKAACGLCSGGIASALCCPVEVSLIRMQADGHLPPAERRGYTSVLNAICVISKKEGVRTLWTGCVPTISRAMVVNLVQLASYDQAKESIQEAFNSKGIATHFAASIVSGFLYCAASLPLDIAKTRMQNQKVVPGQPPVYRSVVQTIGRIVKLESVFALYRGFWPYFARGGLHTVVMFMLLEQFKENATYLNYSYKQ